MLTTLVAFALGSMSVSAKLDTLVDAHMAEHHTMGVSAVVLQDGRVVAESYRGFADQAGGVKVGADTRFRLASISKSVTATIVLQQVEKGKIDLDADIRDYVPEWPDKGQKITMREILAHRSGIRHYATGKNDTSYKELSSLEALKMFANDDLLFAPGEKYSYSTHAYTLAAAALERATGKAMPELVAELSKQAGTPNLQCENLSASWPMWRSRHYSVKDGVAIPAGRAENISWKYGGGGMESTAVDLAKFGDAVLRSKVLSLKARDMLWTDPESDGYGLGWEVSGDLRRHSGSQQGAQSYLMIDVKSGLIVVVLTNTVPNPPGALAKKIYDMARLSG